MILLAGQKSRRLAVMLLSLICLLCSCSAAKQAIDRGNDLATAGDYRGALREYQRALRIEPDSEEAAQHVAQMKPYAIRAADEDGRAALGAGRYEEAMQHVAYIRSVELDSPVGTQLERDTRSQMRSQLLDLIAQKRMSEAYPLAIRTNALFHKQIPELATVFETLRKHYFDLSEQHLAAGAYDQALASLDVITHYEPALAPVVQPRRSRVQNLWADSLVASASQAEAEERIGTAAALLARAYEIAGRDKDLQAMRRHAEKLRAEGGFGFSSTFTGAAERASRLARLVTAAAAGVPGITPAADPTEASLALSAEAPPASCSQTETVSRQGQQYVAGTKQVPNPEHQQLTAQVVQQEQQVADLERAERDLSLDVQRLRSQHTRCDTTRLRPAERALSRAERELLQASAKVTAQAEVVANLERRLARLRRKQGSKQEQDALEQELQAARQKLSDLQAAEQQAQSAVNQARQSRDSAASECLGYAAERQQAESRLSGVEGALAGARATLQASRLRLASTPLTVTEEIVDTFYYDEHHHTRTCTGQVLVTIEPAWAELERRQISASAETTDASHPAYTRYGVLNDPLSFPSSDDQLIAQADGDNAGQITALLEQRVKGYYRFMTDRALSWADSQPDDATDIMIALYLAAPKQLEPGAIEAFQAHLRKRHGLSDLAILNR